MVAKALLSNKLIRGIFSIGGLYLLYLALKYAGQGAALLPGADPVLSVGLLGLSKLVLAVIGLIVFISFLSFVFRYAGAIYEWLIGLIGFETPANNSVQSIINNIDETVSILEKNGDQSGELVASTNRQTGALVEIVQILAETAQGHKEMADSLRVALAALASRDVDKIAEAAARVKDQDIRSLLLQPDGVVGESYWRNARMMVGAQLGAVEEKQTDYNIMAGTVMKQLALIKVRLLVVESYIDMSQVAVPLAIARHNLEETGYLLKIPTNEKVNLNRILPGRSAIEVIK